MVPDLSPFPSSSAAAHLQASAWTSGQRVHAPSQLQQPTCVCILMPREAALNMRLKGLPCVCLCACVRVRVAMAVATGCYLFTEAVSLLLLLHCGSVCPPLRDIQTLLWTRLHVCVCVSIWFLCALGTQREANLFVCFFNHTITEFLYSPSVHHHFHPVHSHPPSSSTDFRDAGSDATTCHRGFEEWDHPPTACCTCCEADVFDLQRRCFKNRRASKISTRQVGLQPPLRKDYECGRSGLCEPSVLI